MPFNATQRNHIDAHITSKLSAKPCPGCGHTEHNKWELADDVGTIHLQHNQVVPVIIHMCQDCGYIAMFHAIQAGVVDQRGNPLADV